MLNCALPTMAEKANEWRPEYLSWGFQSPPSSLYLTSVYGKEPVVSDHLSLVSELRPGSARFPHAPEQYKILRESRQARASTLCFLCTILITGRDYNKKKVKNTCFTENNHNSKCWLPAVGVRGENCLLTTVFLHHITWHLLLLRMNKVLIFLFFLVAFH